MTTTYGGENKNHLKREKSPNLKRKKKKVFFLKIDFKEWTCREKEIYKWNLPIIVYFFAGLICHFYQYASYV